MAEAHTTIDEPQRRGGDGSDRGGRGRASERTCVVTGVIAPPERLIRFALGPGDVVTPDLGRKLPGRGAYVVADREAILRAVTRNLFSKSFRRPAVLAEGVDAEGLASNIENELRRRFAAALGLARRAGEATVGLDKLEALRTGRLALVAAAFDAGDRGARQARRIAERQGAALSTGLSNAAISAAIGLDGVHFVGVRKGASAMRPLAEAFRLGGMTPGTYIPAGDADAAPARQMAKGDGK